MEIKLEISEEWFRPSFSFLTSSLLLCRWMEACLGEDLPPTTELEEGLRNGVYLAKLGNFFSPRVVSLKKIYDREQTRYKVSQAFLAWCLKCCKLEREG